jgi:pyruvate dehydrogenase E1 component
VKGQASTQAGFGRVLDEIARANGPLAERIVTTSPDVTVSTNLGPWVNRRGLFSMVSQEDVFKQRGLLSPQKWEMGPKGQHFELGIAEMNLFLMLSALGLSHALFGERLLPVGTLYDPFICRGPRCAELRLLPGRALYRRRNALGHHPGAGGGAHQSIGTPLIGMAQDGLATFEAGLRRRAGGDHGMGLRLHATRGQEDGEQRWHRDEKGGSVYLRLSTRPLDQLARPMTGDFREAIIDGGYWLRRPEPAASSPSSTPAPWRPEAIEAAGLLAEDRRGVGVLAVTSADRLSAGWHAAQRAREQGDPEARRHIESLLARCRAMRPSSR